MSEEWITESSSARAREARRDADALERGSAPAALSARRTFRSGGRSPARATMLILGGVIVAAAVVVVVLMSLNGSSSKGPASSALVTATAPGHAKARKTHSKSSNAGTSSKSPAAAAPAKTNVVVLNGTETTGLAHQISAELSQAGYTQAKALSGRPPGANQVSVVEYSSGDRADAEGVAHAAGVSQVQPMEATVASLSGSASVVVIVGLDKAATAP